MRRALAGLTLLALLGCSGEPAPAPTADPQQDPGPPRPHDQEAPPVAPLTAAELQQRAEEALGPKAMMTRLTPPLPASWPDAGGRVVFLAYRREPLPSGRVRYLVRPPRHAVEVDVGTGAARVVELPAADEPLGEVERRGGAPDGLDAAAQALVDVVAGRRAADEARSTLAPYARWLEAEPEVAGDLRSRPEHAAFVSWVSGR